MFWQNRAIIDLYIEKRKEVTAYMAYRFPGVDVDDLIFGESETVVSER